MPRPATHVERRRRPKPRAAMTRGAARRVRPALRRRHRADRPHEAAALGRDRRGRRRGPVRRRCRSSTPRADMSASASMPSTRTGRSRWAGCAPATARSIRSARRRGSRSIRHDREEPLTPGVPVPVEIELWPSSTLFRAGETLRLVVAGLGHLHRGGAGPALRPPRAAPQRRAAHHPHRRALRFAPARPVIPPKESAS